MTIPESVLPNGIFILSILIIFVLDIRRELNLRGTMTYNKFFDLNIIYEKCKTRHLNGRCHLIQTELNRYKRLHFLERPTGVHIELFNLTACKKAPWPSAI